MSNKEKDDRKWVKDGDKWRKIDETKSSPQLPDKNQIWIIRVGDGKNFLVSKEPFWGMSKTNGLKTRIEKMKAGDLLCFITSKPHGGKVIGMAEYTGIFYDREEEPLIMIHTKSNKDQGWDGPDKWIYQIYYRNLYHTNMANIKCIIQCASSFNSYETFKDRIDEDLWHHWKMFKKYGTLIN